MTIYAYYFDQDEKPKTKIKEMMEEARERIISQNFLDEGDRLVVIPSNHDFLEVVYSFDDGGLFEKFGITSQQKPLRFVLTINVGQLSPKQAEKYTAQVLEVFNEFKLPDEKVLALMSRTGGTHLQVLNSTAPKDEPELLNE